MKSLKTYWITGHSIRKNQWRTLASDGLRYSLQKKTGGHKLKGGGVRNSGRVEIGA